jgi:23S rRNA pseudoU1915 N3-methylase RlmH
LIISGWNGFDYELSEKFEYHYTNGMMTQALNLSWSGSEWIEIAQQNYSYDAQDRLTEYVSLSYNDLSQSWENVYRMMNTYYGNDSLMTIAQEGNVNDWENIFKTINHFNQDGKSEMSLIYGWENSSWVAEAMGEYEYDANGNLKLLVESVYEDDEWSVLGRAIYGYIPTNTTDVDEDDLALTEYKLYDNYPNPFNPSTVIRYHLASESTVSVKVYDITGSEVAELINEVQTAGTHNINFNASGMASGVFVYKVSAKSIDGKNSFSDVKKMMLMK